METQITETKREFKYDAFISYRHAELDIYAAEHLHKLLENFRVPRLADQELKKSQKRRINRVFRDKDELPASDNLAAPIEEALRNSQFLIVVCSPRTPELRWVSKETEQYEIEPLAADVRGNSKADVHRNLKHEVLRLALTL